MKKLCLLLALIMLATTLLPVCAETAPADAPAETEQAEEATESSGGQASDPDETPYVDVVSWLGFEGMTNGYLCVYPEAQEWQIKWNTSRGGNKMNGTYLPDGTMEYDTTAIWATVFPMADIVAQAEPIIRSLLAGEVSIQSFTLENCDHKFWNSECILCGTVCEHPTWSKGICETCGKTCAHETVDEATRLCTVCGTFIAADPGLCAHEWGEDGVCALCLMECEHPDWTAVDVYTFDMHTESQKEYIATADWPSALSYYLDGEKGHPKALICDFAGDGVANAETYIFQKAADKDFTDPVTVTGLTEKSYALYNLLLGEHFFWRGGASLEDIAGSPAHEVIVNDVGPRTCHVEGIMNVRDVGGYASSLVEGGYFRQGLYYRGAAPDSITEIGVDRFVNELGIRAEIDLRDADACTGPYVEGVDYYTASIPSGTENTRFEEFAEEYQIIFGVIANAGEKPVYLHCSAGADRTGISTFILLAVCGVSYDDIAKDYMFTNFSGQNREITSLDTWWAKLQNLEGETTADKAVTWLLSKGIPMETVEQIRTTFVEGYAAK